MNRIISSAVLAGVVVCGAVALRASSPGADARPSVGVELFDSPVLVFDSSEPGMELQSGIERPIDVGGVRPLAEITIGANRIDPSNSSYVPSRLYVHACGAAPDLSQPAVAYAGPGKPFDVNLAPIDAGPSPCITLYGSAGVAIMVIGDEAGVGGLNYVAHPEFVSVPARYGLFAIRVDVTDESVPPNAEAVAIWVSMVGERQNGSRAIAVDCGDGHELGQQLGVGWGGYADNLFILPIDASGDVCFWTGGLAPARLFTVRRYGYLAPGVEPSAEGLPYAGYRVEAMPRYTASSAHRVIDTREASQPLAGATELRHHLADLPESTTAIAATITATQTSQAGFVRAYACADPPPTLSTNDNLSEGRVVSNVNFTGPGQTVAAFAIIPIGTDHELCLESTAETHLVVDVSGYFAFGLGDGYSPTTPQRLYDSRGSATPSDNVHVVSLPQSAITARSAVNVNLTATEAGKDGYLVAYSCNEARPPTSNLNFQAGETRANTVVARVSSDGDLCVYSSTPVHLVADLFGYYEPGSDVGLVDTNGQRQITVDGTTLPGGVVTGVGWPAGSDARAVAWTITATQPTGPGYVALFPCGSSVPSTSNINFSSAGTTVANFAIVPTAGDGQVCAYSLVTTELLVDGVGSFVPPQMTQVFLEGQSGPHWWLGYRH